MTALGFIPVDWDIGSLYRLLLVTLVAFPIALHRLSLFSLLNHIRS